VTQVRDGDTIVVGKHTAIRLQGVHAPEFDEQGGYEAQRFMAQFVTGERVECRLTGERSNDREIGTCYIDGRDIGAALIAALHRPAARPRGEGHRRHVKMTGEVCLHDEKIDRMAFRKPSNPKRRAIRWLPRECSSLGGRIEVRFPRTWSLSGKSRLDVGRPIGGRRGPCRGGGGRSALMGGG